VTMNFTRRKLLGRQCREAVSPEPRARGGASRGGMRRRQVTEGGVAMWTHGARPMGVTRSAIHMTRRALSRSRAKLVEKTYDIVLRDTCMVR
jgi:hypothetical protein